MKKIWYAREVDGNTLQLIEGSLDRMGRGDYLQITTGPTAGRYTVTEVNLNRDPVQITLSPFRHILPLGVRLEPEIARSPALRVTFS